MKSISITKLDDSGWKKCLVMNQEIIKKFYPDKYTDRDSWQQYKIDKLNNLESSKDFYFDEHVILEDNTPVAWVDYASASYSSGFSFDSTFEDIPSSVMREIFKLIYRFMNTVGIDKIHHWTYNERRLNLMKNNGMDVQEELLLSRLAREDMNAEFYSGIVDKYSGLQGFELLFLNDIEDLLDKYVRFVNEMFEDINNLNPVKQQEQELNKNDWVRIFNMNRDAGSIMNMYILLDSRREIAALTCNYIDSKYKDNIRQVNGLTGVSRKYRGRGFGRFLKAKMYLKLLAENSDFKYITTDTAVWNKYMYRINEELGFKVYKTGYKFEITKNFLENYLKKN